MFLYFLVSFLLNIGLSISYDSYCTITDGEIILKKFDINYNIQDTSDVDLIIEGKLCRIKKVEEILNCLEYQEVYNKRWVFYHNLVNYD
jgi:hypothetical protein